MKPAYLLVVAAALALFAAACGTTEDPEAAAPPAETEPEAELDFVQGELHECAEGMPVPDELSILESGLAPSQMDFETCLTTMQGQVSVEAASAAYQASFDAAGWEHAFEQEDELGQVLRFTDPACGFLMVVTGQTAVELGLVAPTEAEQAPSVALAQIVPCEAMPPPPAEQ
jgi:hypothetical protein